MSKAFVRVHPVYVMNAVPGVCQPLNQADQLEP